MFKNLLFLIFIGCSALTFGQNTGKVSGVVKNESGDPLIGVEVQAGVSGEKTQTDSLGAFSLELAAPQKVFITFYLLGYQPSGIEVDVAAGANKIVEVSLSVEGFQTGVVTIKEQKTGEATTVQIKTKVLDNVVSASDDALSVVKSQASVSSNNELSSAYSVRGGNFDENLIYVNDIQVYRPFLVRSGRQEGLSFVNSDMISSITFSAGGFDAKYGDKLSSVLDITYKNPDSLSASVNMSLLGARVHLEDRIGKFSYIMGGRYKSNAYLLGALETDGEYRPVFYDYQTLLNYKASGRLEISFLGNASLNKYRMVPESRITRFGGINNAFQLRINFDGQEVDRFQTNFGALSFKIKPTGSDSLQMVFTASAFHTVEEETFDILGAYQLNELETNFGEDDFGSAGALLGDGGFIERSRNFLNASILNLEHRGKGFWKGGLFLWGAKWQHEIISDELSEWTYQDSADYAIPLGSANDIQVTEYLKSSNELESNRLTAFVQNNWSFLEKAGRSQLYINTGVRANYWDYNEQLVISPRVSFVYAPFKADSAGRVIDDSTKLTYRVAWGYYYQPPFYRELRDRSGNVHSGVQAQKSIHYVAGVDYDFYAYGRPFTWRSEAYFKDMYDIIPFDVENVRIRYYGENSAKAYAYGAESRLNGEFIKGLESWMSLAYMKTEESISTDQYYEYYNASGEKIISGFTFDQTKVDSVQFDPGYMPRSTDQRVSVKIFFQDEMPKHPALKMHLNLVYGTGLPFGPPGSARDRNALRMPDYRRVDIGFSFQIIEDHQRLKGTKKVAVRSNSGWRYFSDLAFRLEVFNLLNIPNTVSYTWISDINNRVYAVPNYLTQRLVNVRLIGKF